MNNIYLNKLVKFKNMNNWRGYPLVGEVIEYDNKILKINVFGLYGQGTTTLIHDVSIEDVEIIIFNNK